MKMDPNDEQRYWRLASYLKTHLTQAYDSSKIVKNMKRFGHLDKSQFGQALIWGNDPGVEIVPLDNGRCNVARALGCFEHNNPNTILLDQTMVERFQDDPGNTAMNYFYTKSGHLVPIVGGTVLHELCHWGNKKANFDERGREYGVKFEKATYGVIIGLPGMSDFGADEEEPITGG